MDEPPPAPVSTSAAPWRPCRAQGRPRLHARQPRSRRAGGGAGSGTPVRARARRGGDAGTRRDRRPRAEPRHGRHAGDAAGARRADRSRRRTTSSRSSTASRRPGNNSLPPGHRIDVVIDHHPVRAGQRARPLVRHPPRFRRHLDDRLRVPARAEGPARRQAGDGLLLRAAHGDARPRARIDRGRAHRLPRAGAAGRPRPPLPDDAPQGAARALRGARPRAPLGAGFRRAGGRQPGDARLPRPRRRDRRSAALLREGARASSAWASTDRTSTCRCAPRPTTPARAASCATSSRRTAPRAATARWPGARLFATVTSEAELEATFKEMVRRLLETLGRPPTEGDPLLRLPGA